jgi:hypothetical protein
MKWRPEARGLKEADMLSVTAKTWPCQLPARPLPVHIWRWVGAHTCWRDLRCQQLQRPASQVVQGLLCLPLLCAPPPPLLCVPLLCARVVRQPQPNRCCNNPESCEGRCAPQLCALPHITVSVDGRVWP